MIRSTMNAVGQGVSYDSDLPIDVPAAKLLALLQASDDMTISITHRDRKSTLDTVARSVHDLLEAESCGVFLVSDQDPKTLVLEANYSDLSQAKFKPVRLKIQSRPRGGLTGHIAYEGKIVRLPEDALRNNPYISGQRVIDHLAFGKCMSLLAIPLKDRKGRLVGLVKADNKKGPDGKPSESASFSAVDESIARILANKIVILLDHMRAAAILRDLIWEMHDAASLRDILNTILIKSRKLLYADRGAMALMDEETNDLILSIQHGGGSLVEGQSLPERSVMRKVWKSGKPCRLGDVSTSQDYHCCDSRTKSELAVSLEWAGCILGVLNVESFKPDFFDERDQDLLMLLAQYAVIAYREVGRNVQFRGILRRLAEDPFPQKDALVKILRNIRDLYKFDAGIIYAADYTQRVLRYAASIGCDGLAITPADFRYNFEESALATKVFNEFNERAGYFSADPANDPCVNPKGLKAFCINSSLVGVPLIAGDRAVGALVVWSRKNPGLGGEESISDLEPFARRAAAHIVNSEAIRLRTQVFKQIADILTQMPTVPTEVSLSKLLDKILRGVQTAGFDRVRIFTYDETTSSFVGLDSLGMSDAEAFKGLRIFANRNPYARSTRMQSRHNALAFMSDPNLPRRRPDPDADRLDKPKDLPWAAVPLVIGGTLYGQITADNILTRRRITEDSLEYMTLLGALAAQIIANAWRHREGRARGFREAAEFLAWTVSHEMRNTSLAVTARLKNFELFNEMEDLRGATDLITALNSTAENLLSITTEIPSNSMPYPVCNILNYALGSMEALLKLRRIEVKIDCREDFHIYAEPLRVVVAFISIIRNAIDAMYDDRRILEIAVSQTRTQIQVIFDDTGTGFDAESLENCLKEGFTARKGSHKGSGLAMVDTIMRDCRGCVIPENRLEGGARITLLFPMPTSE